MLYVDVDDTLVKWSDTLGRHPMGYGGEEPRPNEPLIAALKKYIALHPNEPIVVWSGGGGGRPVNGVKSYAQRWADEYIPDLYDVTMTKDFSRDFSFAPGPEDICIDDESLKVAAQVLTAEQFVLQFG